MDKHAVKILFQAFFQPCFKFGLPISKWVLHQVDVEGWLSRVRASNVMVKPLISILQLFSPCRRVYCHPDI